MNAIDKCTVKNASDVSGNPAGGFVLGTGILIDWQNGPLGRGETRRRPNGAFVETVIAAALQRLEYYQAGKFACEENACAIDLLNHALLELNHRTAHREMRGVEGTHVL
jgi:hypothetical protein